MPVGDVDRIGAETTDRVRDVDNKLDAPHNICARALGFPGARPMLSYAAHKEPSAATGRNKRVVCYRMETTKQYRTDSPANASASARHWQGVGAR